VSDIVRVHRGLLKAYVYPFARLGEGLRRKRAKRGKKGMSDFGPRIIRLKSGSISLTYRES